MFKNVPNIFLVAGWLSQVMNVSGCSDFPSLSFPFAESLPQVCYDSWKTASQPSRPLCCCRRPGSRWDPWTGPATIGLRADWSDERRVRCVRSTLHACSSIELFCQKGLVQQFLNPFLPEESQDSRCKCFHQPLLRGGFV